jgi:hypothetical protein
MKQLATQEAVAKMKPIKDKMEGTVRSWPTDPSFPAPDQGHRRDEISKANQNREHRFCGRIHGKAASLTLYAWG